MADCDKDHCRYDHDAVTQVWQALGNPAYDGRHISEHVAEVVTHARALQAEREELIYDLNETRRLAFNRGQQTKIAVEAFRQRAATRLRASGDEFGAPEYYAAADIVGSLLATEEVGNESER